MTWYEVWFVWVTTYDVDDLYLHGKFNWGKFDYSWLNSTKARPYKFYSIKEAQDFINYQKEECPGGDPYGDFEIRKKVA